MSSLTLKKVAEIVTILLSRANGLLESERQELECRKRTDMRSKLKTYSTPKTQSSVHLRATYIWAHAYATCTVYGKQYSFPESTCDKRKTLRTEKSSGPLPVRDRHALLQIGTLPFSFILVILWRILVFCSLLVSYTILVGSFWNCAEICAGKPSNDVRSNIFDQ
jgi:hypothetical protein